MPRRQGPSTKVIISACLGSLDPDMRCHAMPAQRRVSRWYLGREWIRSWRRTHSRHSLEWERVLSRYFERSRQGARIRKREMEKEWEMEKDGASVETRRTPSERHLRTEACTRHRNVSQGRRETAAPCDVLRLDIRKHVWVTLCDVCLIYAK